MKHKNSNQGCKKRPYSDALIRLWPVNHSTFDRPRRTKTIPKQYWGKVVCCVEMPSGCYVDKKGVPKPLDPRSGKIVVEEHSDDHDDDSEDEDYEETDQEEANDKEDSDEEYTAPNMTKSKGKTHKPIIPLPTETTEMQTTEMQTEAQTTEAKITEEETTQTETQIETTQIETQTETTQGNQDNLQSDLATDNKLTNP